MVVLKIDPSQGQLALLTPALAERIHKHADEHQADVQAREYTSAVMARLWLQDPGQLLIGIVDETTGQLIGHALAQHEVKGSRASVVVRQLRADGNVGDARMQALDLAVQWARSLGTKHVIVQTHRDGKEFERLGFKRYQTLHKLDLQA